MADPDHPATSEARPDPAPQLPGATGPGAEDVAALLHAQLETLREVMTRQLALMASLGGDRPLPAQAAGGGKAPVPLTPEQMEIWLAAQQGGLAEASFTLAMSLEIDGPLDRAALGAALDALLARHDALRLRIAADGSGFTVAAPGPVALDARDFADAPDPQAAFRAFLLDNAAAPPDPVAGPVFRATLARLGDEAHVLVMTAHHIACDGWSFNLMAEELATLYSAAHDGRAADLPPAPSFAAHARAQAGRAPRPGTLEHWRAALSPPPEPLDLPTDRPRGALRDMAGATWRGHVDAAATARLRKAAAEAGVTLNALVFAGLQMTLGRLSGSDDVVLAIPAAGQARDGIEGLVGHCARLLPVRAPFRADEPARDHLQRAARALWDALDHGDVTFGTLLRELDVPRAEGRMPLAQVQFSFQRLPGDLALGPARARLRPNPVVASNFELFVNVYEGAEGLTIDVDHAAALFDAATVERWMASLRVLLAALAEAPETPVARLPLMPPEEEARLAEAFNRTTAAFDREARIEALVERMARQDGAAPAVRGPDAAFDRAGLAAASDALAALIQARVPGHGARIGVAVPRGAAMLVALLAVLKSGHAYVPLDPEQPAERLRRVLATAEAAALLAPGAAAAALVEGTDIAAIDPAEAVAGQRPAPHGCGAGDTAYVIFTSGSTGTPKGVEIAHRSVVNFLTSMAREPGLTPGDRVLAVTTAMFDIAVLELFGPLVAGAELEIAPREMVRDGFALARRLADTDITLMQGTPTLWAMLLEAGFAPRPGLKMLAGGEPLPEDLAHRLTAGGAELWNMYGPTETTIWSSVARVLPDAPVTIGAPIANTEMHVLDAADGLCPPGVVGELNIGGAGLARGYFGRPDLSAAAFRQVTLAGRARRLYRTGDMAARGADGAIRLLGRRDGQVKLRGYRIELGEIEARLREIPGVAAAAVAVKPRPGGGDPVLVGYVVPGPGAAAAPADLAARLGKVLPDYMVPGRWLELAALPKTANGKLDRQALPEPSGATAAPNPGTRPVSDPAPTPAAPDTEARLAAIWASVLGRTTVPREATLGELGIDSLTLFRLVARMADAGFAVQARDLFAHPGLRALAAHLDGGATAPATPPPAASEPAPAPRDAGPDRPPLSDFLHGARRPRSGAA